MIEQIKRLPRVSLGCYPTPLIEAERLSEVLGGPRILVKRDDLTGLALGGNKCRRLEFLMGEARQKGFDSFLISGIHNTTVQLAAASAKLGFKFRQLIHGDLSCREKQGNYTLHRILDSDMKFVKGIDLMDTFEGIRAQRDEALETEKSKLIKEGFNPIVMKAWQSTPVENVGWVHAADEILQQLSEQNVNVQYVVLSTCQGATQAGLTVGTKYLNAPFKVIGISTYLTKAKAISEVVRMSNETAKFLELGINIRPDEVIVYDEYIGEGYGKITEECVEAIKLVAQAEGFFLDPVYTGKAMAGLIDLIKKGRLTSNDTVIFIHTGGIPSLFAYCEELTSDSATPFSV